jgi:hypothetical protein
VNLLICVLAAQLCQAHVQKRSLFLETDDWKSIPWTHTPKTTQDRLLDILVHLPSLLERITSQVGYAARDTRFELVEKIESLRRELVNWRWAWENLYPNSVREKRVNLNLSDLNVPCFRDLLSTALEFDNPNRAAELLTYNAAMIELELLRCAVSDEEVHFHTSIPDLNGHSTRGTVSDGSRKTASTYLLMPNELEFLWQPAIEALRILALMRKRFSVGDVESFLSLSPIGILYSFVKKFGMQNLVVDIIGHSLDIQQAEKELVHSLHIRMQNCS